MRVFVFILAWTCTGCQLWKSVMGSDEGAEVKASPETSETTVPESAQPTTGSKLPTPERTKSPAATGDNDVELRLAKLWARVDELQNHVVQQKERMKLLEKGLMLGIIPEELKNPSAAAKSLPKSDPPSEEIGLEESKEKNSPPPAENLALASEKSDDPVAYRQLLQKAQEKFNAAQYGQAIVHFNEISERFVDTLSEGSQHYWIGLSWFYLKEYQLAEQSFKSLTELYAANSWVPHARFYRAKIDQNRGMNQRALSQFQQLMEEFSDQDLGEMARMEVARMKDKF